MLIYCFPPLEIEVDMWAKALRLDTVSGCARPCARLQRIASGQNNHPCLQSHSSTNVVRSSFWLLISNGENNEKWAMCTGSCPARWLSVDKVLWKHSKWLIIVILVATVRLIKFGLPCFCRSKEAPRILWTSVGTLMPDHAPKKLFVRQSLDKAATAMTCRHVPCESTMIISHGLQIFVWLYRCYQFMSPCNLKIGSCLRKGRGYNNSSCSWRSGQASRYAFNVLTYLL